LFSLHVLLHYLTELSFLCAEVICKPTNSGGSKDIRIFADAAAAVQDPRRAVACR
jgi:hypothetical protein